MTDQTLDWSKYASYERDELDESTERHIFFGGTWKQQNCVKCGQRHYVDWDWTVDPDWHKPCTVPTELYEQERKRLLAYFMEHKGKWYGYSMTGFAKTDRGYIVHSHQPRCFPQSVEVPEPSFQDELKCARWRTR